MLTHLLITALASAYVVTALERFVDLTFIRGFIALGVTALGVWIFGYREGPALMLSMGGAFLALMTMSVVEAVVSRETILADLRSGRRII